MYDIPPDILKSLSLKDASGSLEPQEGSVTGLSPRRSTSSLAADTLVGSQSCSLCSLAFLTVQDQRSHLKSDLHHYNLKQKLRGGIVASEAEFEKLIGGVLPDPA